MSLRNYGAGDSERIGRVAIITDHNQTSHFSHYHLIHYGLIQHFFINLGEQILPRLNISIDIRKLPSVILGGAGMAPRGGGKTIPVIIVGNKIIETV